MTNLLEIKNMTKTFYGVTAVSDLSMEVKRNSIHSLIGPNGAGKTTVFNCITGAYVPDTGEIKIGDIHLEKKKPNKIVIDGVARTYQNIRLFKKMTALENVMTGFHCRTKSNSFNVLFKYNKMKEEEIEVKEKSLALLEYFNLYNDKDSLAGSLPYGHQRLLEIARALATQPKILLLDEPAAGMNTFEKQSLINTIRRIRQDFDVTILLVEHDMDLVMNISDEITVLNYGQKVANGKPQEIRSNEKVIEAYLGKDEDDEDN